MHSTGIVAIARALLRIRGEHWSGRIFLTAPGAIAAISIVGVALAALHGLECAVWALVYLRLGALGSPADALLYSVDSMTTRGASGLTLAPHWLMMGALEAADGMLLFGASAALLIVVIQRIFAAVFAPPAPPQA